MNTHFPFVLLLLLFFPTITSKRRHRAVATHLRGVRARVEPQMQLAATPAQLQQRVYRESTETFVRLLLISCYIYTQR